MINVLIVDDHPIVRHGLKQVLANTADMTVVDEAENGLEALDKIYNHNYDVVVLDITLPDSNGLDILKRMKEIKPDMPVIILSIHPEKYYALQALKAGASGYLTKNRAAKELIDALTIVAQGRKYVSSALAEILASKFDNNTKVPDHEKLTPREYEIMCMIVSGMPLKDIANKLSISIKTVSTHRLHILEKMYMTNNSQLIQYAVRCNILK